MTEDPTLVENSSSSEAIGESNDAMEQDDAETPPTDADEADQSNHLSSASNVCTSLKFGGGPHAMIDSFSILRTFAPPTSSTSSSSSLVSAKDSLPSKKAFGKFKFLRNTNAVIAESESMVCTKETSVANGIVDASAGLLNGFAAQHAEPVTIVEGFADSENVSEKLELLEGAAVNGEQPPPPPPPPTSLLPKRGRGRPRKPASNGTRSSAVPARRTRASAKDREKTLHLLDDSIGSVLRTIGVIDRSNKTADSSSMTNSQTDLDLKAIELCTDSSSCLQSTASKDGKQPTTPDTGFKLKSRWLNRSEQDLPNVLMVRSPPPNSVSSTASTDHSATHDSKDQKENINMDDAMSSAAMPVFDRILDNIHLDDRIKSKSKESKRMLCECTLTNDDGEELTIGCGEDCLNRILYIECGPKCRCRNLCSNRRFQNHQYAAVVPFPAGPKGWGLKADKHIPKHAFVMEYVGEVLNSKHFRGRIKQYARDPAHRHHYFMALGNDEVIDATQKGNISRFINHSCQPNCETQKWTVDGRLRIGFFTIADISAGEEITFDYRFQRYGKEAQKCYCGSANCRGVIGGEAASVSASTQRVSRENVKKKDKVQRPIFEDILFDQELADMIAAGTLKNRDHMLMFSRLMVRAEDIDARMQLLKLLQNTNESSLRLFIDHHGCQLLWSWMVDDQPCERSWVSFQLAVLEILQRLPIPHRNMVEESRLLRTVERWAKDPASRLKRKPSVQNDDDIVKSVLHDLVGQVACDATPDTNEESVAADDNVETDRTPPEERNVVKTAEAVLAHWANLKENFRIPKKSSFAEKEKPFSEKDRSCVINESDHHWSSRSRRHRSRSAGRRDARSRSISPRGRQKRRRSRSRSRSRQRSRSRSYSSRRQSRSRSRSRSDYRQRYNRQPYSRRSRSLSKDTRRDRGKRYERRSPDRDRTAAADEITRKSKEERRREFEAAALKLEEEKRRKRQEMELETQTQSVENMPFAYGGGGSYWPTQDTPTLPADTAAFSSPAAPTVIGPPACIANGNVNIGGAAMAFLVHDPNTNQYWWQDQVTKVLVYPADDRQVAAVHSGNYSVVPHFYNDPRTGLIHEVRVQAAAAVPGALDDLDEVDMACDDDPLSREERIAILKEQIANLQNELEAKRAELRWLLEHDGASSAASDDRPPSSLPPDWKTARDNEGNVYYYHVKTRVTQWEPPSWDDVKPKSRDPPSSSKKVDRHSTKSSTSKAKPHSKKKSRQSDRSKYVSSQKLHSSSSNSSTRIKQEQDQQQIAVVTAAVPVVEQAPSVAAVSLEPVESVVPSSTVNEHPQQTTEQTISIEWTVSRTPHGTTMAAADTSSEGAKKMKESFKGQISNQIIKYLSIYRKPECKIGRITCNDDFKHLARKLTHTVMEKELKHCTSVEDLRVTESVMHKAKDYIKKYMSKLGTEYKRTASSP